MLWFLIINMAAVTSRANQQYVISEFPRASVSKRGQVLSL